MLKYSFFKGFNLDGYQASIALLKLHHQDQKNIEDFKYFIVNSDAEGTLNWLDNFKGLRKLKVIILIFHELFMGESNDYQNEFRAKFSGELINLFLSIEDTNELKWTNYFSIKVIFKIQVELIKSGVENFSLWRHEFDVSEILMYSDLHLDLIIRIIKEPISDLYYQNIEKLINNESQHGDFNRIQKIILSIDKDGIKQVEEDYEYKYRKIDRFLFQIMCLNELIPSEHVYRNDSFDLQKRIIYSISNGPSKLEVINKVIQEFEDHLSSEDFENLNTAIADCLDVFTDQSKIKILFDIYPVLASSQRLSRISAETINNLLRNKLYSKNISNEIANEIANLIYILKLQSSNEITYWTEKRNKILLKLERAKLNPFRRPFYPNQGPDKYIKHLLTYFLNRRDKDNVIKSLKILLADNDITRIDFDLIIQCYKYLKEINDYEVLPELKIKFDEKLNDSNFDPEELEKKLINYIDSLNDPIKKINCKCFGLKSNFKSFSYEEIFKDIDKIIDSDSSKKHIGTIWTMLEEINNPSIQYHLLLHLGKLLQKSGEDANATGIFSIIIKLDENTKIPDDLNAYCNNILVNDTTIEVNSVFIKFIKKYFSKLDSKQLLLWEDYENVKNKMISYFVKVAYLIRVEKIDQTGTLLQDIINFEIPRNNDDWINQTYDFRDSLIHELLN
jgi:hypothetical protein